MVEADRSGSGDAMRALECDSGDSVCFAKSSGLRYVTDTRPGYTRALKKDHFVFFDLKGKAIRDKAEIARIRALAIPPAYTQVWICPYENGHLQATGIDARGRKQYRYHPDWRQVRDAAKFYHIITFGETLPKIRAITKQHMAQPQLTREKILATVVCLLEKTKIRVGNEEYARTNESYGLTTLREEHVELQGDRIRFRFKGKSGKEWNVKLTDRRIAKILRQCEEIEGQELFKYVDAAGAAHDVTSGDVNRYLQEITGTDFTAKDYRTWSGTVIAAMALQEYAEYDTAAQAKKNVLTAIEHVAKHLGNTPAICRKCYIHPAILDAYLDGSFMAQMSADIDASLKKQDAAHLRAEEMRVLSFLRKRVARQGTAARKKSS